MWVSDSSVQLRNPTLSGRRHWPRQPQTSFSSKHMARPPRAGSRCLFWSIRLESGGRRGLQRLFSTSSNAELLDAGYGVHHLGRQRCTPGLFAHIFGVARGGDWSRSPGKWLVWMGTTCHGMSRIKEESFASTFFSSRIVQRAFDQSGMDLVSC
jgi:hypothetical protein